MIYWVDQAVQPQIEYGMLMDYGKMPMILSQLKQAINLMDGILSQMEMESKLIQFRRLLIMQG